MQITPASAAFSRPSLSSPEPSPSPDQEIKRLVTVIKAAEVGARMAPTTRAEAATRDIQRIATMITAAQAGASVDPGRSATERAAAGYHSAAATTAQPETAKLLLSA